MYKVNTEYLSQSGCQSELILGSLSHETVQRVRQTNKDSRDSLALIQSSICRGNGDDDDDDDGDDASLADK